MEPPGPDATAFADDNPSRAMRRYADALLVLAAARCALVAVEMREDLVPMVRGLWDPNWRSFSFGPVVEPIDLVRVGWPLALAVLIRLFRWPSLAKAAAWTMGVLVLHRVIGAGLGAMVAAGSPGAWPRRLGVGFDLGAGPTTVAITLARRILAFVLDLAFAMAALRVWRRSRRIEGPQPRGSRRAIVGRLTMLGVVIFAGLLLGARAWDAYVDVLNFSPRIRQLILRSDPAGRSAPVFPRRRTGPTFEDRLLLKIDEGIALEIRGKHAEARTAGVEAVRMLDREKTRPRRRDGGPRQEISGAANNLAWRFATGKQPSREPEVAVALARASLDVADDGMTWNTLGVAELRAGDWAAADKAFARSLALRDGGDSFDWFFLAILRHREGDTDAATFEYDRAVKWYREQRPDDLELRAFQLEAAETLGLPRPPELTPREAVPPKRRTGAVRPSPAVAD